jgi:hypothetical protein
MPAVVVPPPAPSPKPAATSPKPAEAVADEQAARWVAVLRGAPDPEARGWAATRLQSVNWRTHPEVVQALLGGAVRDTAGSVRTSCIRALNGLDANTNTVLAALDTLRADHDPAVKQAAEEALRGMQSRRRQ